MTVTVHKSNAGKNGQFLYINLHGFRDKAHREVIFKKIDEIIRRDANTKMRVF